MSLHNLNLSNSDVYIIFLKKKKTQSKTELSEKKKFFAKRKITWLRVRQTDRAINDIISFFCIYRVFSKRSL